MMSKKILQLILTIYLFKKKLSLQVNITNSLKSNFEASCLFSKSESDYFGFGFSDSNKIKMLSSNKSKRGDYEISTGMSKVTSLADIKNSTRFFVGGENGRIEMYDLNDRLFSYSYIISSSSDDVDNILSFEKNGFFLVLTRGILHKIKFEDGFTKEYSFDFGTGEKSLKITESGSMEGVIFAVFGNYLKKFDSTKKEVLFNKNFDDVISGLAVPINENNTQNYFLSLENKIVKFNSESDGKIFESLSFDSQKIIDLVLIEQYSNVVYILDNAEFLVIANYDLETLSTHSYPGLESTEMKIVQKRKKPFFGLLTQEYDFKSSIIFIPELCNTKCSGGCISLYNDTHDGCEFCTEKYFAHDLICYNQTEGVLETSLNWVNITFATVEFNYEVKNFSIENNIEITTVRRGWELGKDFSLKLAQVRNNSFNLSFSYNPIRYDKIINITIKKVERLNNEGYGKVNSSVLVYKKYRFMNIGENFFSISKTLWKILSNYGFLLCSVSPQTGQFLFDLNFIEMIGLTPIIFPLEFSEFFQLFLNEKNEFEKGDYKSEFNHYVFEGNYFMMNFFLFFTRILTFIFFVVSKKIFYQKFEKRKKEEDFKYKIHYLQKVLMRIFIASTHLMAGKTLTFIGISIYQIPSFFEVILMIIDLCILIYTEIYVYSLYKKFSLKKKKVYTNLENDEIDSFEEIVIEAAFIHQERNTEKNLSEYRLSLVRILPCFTLIENLTGVLKIILYMLTQHFEEVFSLFFTLINIPLNLAKIYFLYKFRSRKPLQSLKRDQIIDLENLKKSRPKYELKRVYKDRKLLLVKLILGVWLHLMICNLIYWASFRRYEIYSYSLVISFLVYFCLCLILSIKSVFKDKCLKHKNQVVERKKRKSIRKSEIFIKGVKRKKPKASLFKKKLLAGNERKRRLEKDKMKKVLNGDDRNESKYSVKEHMKKSRLGRFMSRAGKRRMTINLNSEKFKSKVAIMKKKIQKEE